MSTTETATVEKKARPKSYIFDGRRVEILADFGSYLLIQDGAKKEYVTQGQLREADIAPGGSSDDGRIPINHALEEDLLTLSSYGIRTKTIARQLIRRRQKGYENFEQFRQLNSDIASLNWDQLRHHLRFD
jgi:hypothetical protein